MLVEGISWHRRGAGSDFVGSLSAGDDGIRLKGRDPHSGLDVVLSIPPPELAGVHVSSTNGDGPEGTDRYVVLELERAEPILLRQVGGGFLPAQLLARKLAALLRTATNGHERRST